MVKKKTKEGADYSEFPDKDTKDTGEEFPIEEGIPVPPSRSPKGSKYPFGKLTVAEEDDEGVLIGSSFSFPLSLMRRVNNAAMGYGKKHGGEKFRVRPDKDDPTKGRCWRIE